jgi:dCMP deaminase
VISNKWDSFFYHIAQDCASMSPCLSRQIGAVIARGKRIVSTGWNGPPETVPHCNVRHRFDEYLAQLFDQKKVSSPGSDCPRRLLGFASGEGLDLCPAIHAEVNAIINAARSGESTLGTIIYMTCGIPCRNCLGSIVNAGISQIVCTSLEWYDSTSAFVLWKSDVSLRLFDQEPIDKYKMHYETKLKNTGP